MSKKDQKEELAKKATSASTKAKKKDKPAPSEPGREVIHVITEELPVDISKKEKRELGLQLANQTEEREKYISHKKEKMADLKSREAQIDAQIKSLSMKIRFGTKTVPVVVHAEADYKEGIVRFIRQDTGEQIRTRPLAPEERQRTIPGTDAASIPPANRENDVKGLPPGVTKSDEPAPPPPADGAPSDAEWTEGEQQGKEPRR